MTVREAIEHAMEGYEQGYPIEALIFLSRWLKKTGQDEAVEKYLTWSPPPPRGR